jgi:hypothetical protein
VVVTKPTEHLLNPDWIYLSEHSDVNSGDTSIFLNTFLLYLFIMNDNSLFVAENTFLCPVL